MARVLINGSGLDVNGSSLILGIELNLSTRQNRYSWEKKVNGQGGQGRTPKLESDSLGSTQQG